jgi:glycosyltransferase involved in cell wall biosynthesis
VKPAHPVSSASLLERSELRHNDSSDVLLMDSLFEQSSGDFEDMDTVTEDNPKKAAVLLSTAPSDLLVVAWLYNTNGMATWCWEAAHALHELGHNVLLVAAPDTPLPGIPLVEVIRISEPDDHASQRSRGMKALHTVSRHLAAGPNGVLLETHKCLADRGVRPTAYILNQTSLVDRRVPCPQIVTAWGYPVSLLAYLRKIPLLVPDKTIRSFLHVGLLWVGWWRRDWRGYRAADRVLPVTHALLRSLHRRSVTASLAYPGTCVGPAPDRGGSRIRLLMAAIQLNEPRKRILWMLDAMKDAILPAGAVLQLAGELDESVRQAAARLSIQVEFLGRLKRPELQKVMQQADIFCFGSLLDDWGYVLVEAMANGLIPVAPAISPFDEIMGAVGSGYRPHSHADFVSALSSVTSSSLVDKRQQAWERAHSLFSREAFGRSILESVESATASG